MSTHNDNWLTKTSSKRYDLVVDGKHVGLRPEELVSILRDKLRSSKTVHKIFDRFGVSMDRVKELNIDIVPLEDKYAETDENGIRINESLLSNPNFIQEQFFILPHEIVHWLTRLKEKEAYFNDPEETLGFICSIAYELEATQDLDSVWNKLYNKINWHFNNENDARKFFENMVIKAKDLLD